MIEAILNLLLHCRHRHMSRPVAPIRKHGIPQGACYVVCLDCGKPFAYDPHLLRIGKPLEGPNRRGIAQPGVPGPTSA